MSSSNLRHSLDGLRKSFASPGEAYLARTRANRMILRVVRHIATLLGANSPEIPGPFAVPDNASQPIKDLIFRCNDATSKIRRLSQPSEVLDLVWQAEWTELLHDLEYIVAHFEEARIRS